MFPNCGGWGFGGEHNINQGCRVRNTAGGSSRPVHLNIQQCVMLTEKQLTQKCPVLSAMCVTHLACEKAACLLYFCFISSIFLFPSEIYFCINI